MTQVRPTITADTGTTAAVAEPPAAAFKSKQPHQQRIAGVITKIRHHNLQTAWFALELRLAQPPGQPDNRVLSVVGLCASELTPGWVLSCTGEVVDSRFGPQFKAISVEASPPRTASGIRKYLSSGQFAGIGTRTADLIVDTFGEATMDVLDRTPEALFELKGLPRKKAEALVEAWRSESEMRDITVFALSQGITMSQIRKIIKAYGQAAPKLIKLDPYRLCRDIYGIGFRKADAIARKLGVAFDSPFRIRAALSFTLEAASQEGHCALPAGVLGERCAELLADEDEKGKSRRVEQAQITAEIEPELQIGRLKSSPISAIPHIFLPNIYAAEQSIARHLYRLQRSPTKSGPNSGLTAEAIDTMIHQACERIGIELAPEQLQAIRTAMTSKVIVITGGPGVGKTTIMRVLLQVFNLNKWAVALCAATGKAAKRLGEASGQAAQTMHRLLGYKAGGFSHDEKSPLEIDALFADEFSMPDVLLTQALLRALPSHCRLIMVGDVDQLPSVGPGNVLSDLIESDQIAVVRLTKIYRQALTSDIVRVAHEINAGHVPRFKDADTDCYFEVCNKTEEIVSVITMICTALLKAGHARRNIQVLSPMSVGLAGTQALNAALRPLLYEGDDSAEERAAALMGFDQAPPDARTTALQVGDRVMQIRNDYGRLVYNGDVGVVLETPTPGVDDRRANSAGESEDDDDNRGKSVWNIQFSETQAEYGGDDLDALRLAYAFTIHKSQGSEFPIVIMPITTSHYVMLRRKLIYTGLTRAKQMAILVGTRRALEIAVRNTDDAKRITKLKEWLCDVPPLNMATEPSLRYSN